CAPAGTIEPTDMRSPTSCFAMSARIVVVVKTCALPPPARPQAARGTAANISSKTDATLFISRLPIFENESQYTNENHTRNAGNEEYAVGYGTNRDADGPRKADNLPRQTPHEAAGHRRAGP